MARIRQQNPSGYISNSKINTEFENIIRYLNTAELGDKTLSELLSVLFDEYGTFRGPIEMRFNSSTGIEYRVGTYVNAEEGWKSIVPVASIRGPSGSNFGVIEGPVFYNRVDYVATAAQTDFQYSRNATADSVMCYVNGVLLATTDVTVVDSANKVVIPATSAGDKVTLYCVRASAISNFRRQETVAVASQVVIFFAHTADERVLVYRNGLLQRPGGTADYVADAASDTVTFTAPLGAGDLITIMTLENTSSTNVGGLMVEDVYTVNGLIRWSKIAVANDEIPRNKVYQLESTLTNKANMFKSITTPTSAGLSDGDLWFDQTQRQLKYFNQANWYSVNPESSIPSFIATNAGQYLRVGASGGSLEWGNIDFSTLVPKTNVGAANGVASLDSSGKLPTNQLPSIFATQSYPLYVSSTVANGNIFLTRLFKQKVRFDGISAKLAAGTCTVQLAVDGIAVGSSFSITTTAINQTFSATVEVDASATGRLIQVIVTNASTASGLEIGFSGAAVAI